MKTKNPIHTALGNERANLPPFATPEQTIAHTIAEHRNDPSHRFHARERQTDGRLSVAAGERLQRVRARAPAN